MKEEEKKKKEKRGGGGKFEARCVVKRKKEGYI